MEKGDACGPRADCDLMISGGRVLSLDAPSGVVDQAAIAVRGGIIVAIGARTEIEASFHAARVIDATGQVVAPGFVDGHVHLGAFLGAGQPYRPSVAPGPFSGGGKVEIILPLIARMCSLSVPAEHVATVVRPALAALLRAGITSVVDAGGPGVEGVVSAAAGLGIRAAIGPCLADLWHDDRGRLARQADPDRLLGQAREAIERDAGAGDGRIRTVVSGIETMACSDALLAGIAELTAAFDLPTHMHSHVTRASVAAHDAAFGRTATRRLSDAGMLTPRCTLMHAGALTDADIAAFAPSGVAVNHNPTGNAMLGFGVATGRSVQRLLAAGVPVILGSDDAPSSVTSPFEMMRAALRMHRDAAAREDAMSLEQVLAMGTNSGPGVGRPGELGRLAQGQLADLVLVDTTGSHHLGADHPVPELVLRARAGDVTTVIVDGRVLVDRGELVGVDEPAIAAEAKQAHASLAAQADG